MSQIIDTEKLRNIAEEEFADIVVATHVPDINELRVFLKDGSFIDVWFSLKLENRYSYHWERRALDGKIFRHDNAPHQKWQQVSTFPRHFHNGSEFSVIESFLSEDPGSALREFLVFARGQLITE